MTEQSVIETTLIEASQSPRPLLTKSVDALADSIRQVGLIQPITVRRSHKFRDGRRQESYQVVAGHHRLAAIRLLGIPQVAAFVISDEMTAMDAELIEIDENLCRAELTSAQRTSAIKRRREIWAAMHPEGIQVEQEVPPVIGYGSPPPQETGFAAETSAAAGMSKQAINRHLARAEALGDDLDAVVGTSLDKGVEMDALAKLPEEDRRELIDRAQAGEVVSARHPDPPDASGMVSTLIDDLYRMAKKYSPEDVAEAVADRALNPDLYPYVEAVFNGYRAARARSQ